MQSMKAYAFGEERVVRLTGTQMCVGKKREKTGQVALGQLWRMQNWIFFCY